MGQQVDKTKDSCINLLNYDEISASYKWELKNTRNTFPVAYWAEALVGILYHNKKTTEIEKEFTQKMPKITKPSNNMYVGSLLQKFLISPNQDTTKIRNEFTEGELEKWVVDHINQIIDKHFLTASERAKVWMKEWREFYEHQYKKTPEYNDGVADKMLNKFREKMSSKNEKFDWEEISVSSYKNSKIEKVKLSNFDEQDFEEWEKFGEREKDDNNSQIGRFGELFFRDALVSKYGVNNVFHISEKYKYAPCDFKVTINKEVHFFEVKSTTKIAFSRFYISKNELDFWKITKEKNQKYSLILVRGITLFNSKNIIFPTIKEIKNPSFKISSAGTGFSNGKILIKPIKFIGQI